MPTEHVPDSTTLGIDLASQPGRTAACLIEWRGGRGAIRPIGEPKRLTDERLLELMRDPAVTKVGIDAPFGWPLEFVDALMTYCDRGGWPVTNQYRPRQTPVPDDDRDRLIFRQTDFKVLAETRQQPMSVTTSWLAWPAMRCAGLLSALSKDAPVDRSGGGLVVEVYPAAALHKWELSPTEWTEDPGTYKGKDPGSRARRERLLASLVQAAGGALSLTPDDTARCIDSDDELDAVICALVARAVDLGRSEPIPKSLQDRAAKEGWLHLPRRDSIRSLGIASVH